jgi:tetratricopeptide (TPR) repeat protein
MIVAYVVDEWEAYWMWFENDTVDLTLPNDTFSIKVDRKSKLTSIDWDGIADYVGQIFSRKYLLYTLPVVTDQNKQAWDLYFKLSFDKALPVFYDLLKAKPNDVSILEAIALSEYHLFNYQKALSYINKALAIVQNESLYANKASILTEQGFFQNDIGKINEAINIYNKLIGSSSSSSSLFYNLGSALTKIEQYEQSITYFKKSLKLNPNKPEVWNNLGNSYMLIAKHSLELECYDNALMIQPDMPETLFSKGSSLFRYFGKIDEGLALMLKSSTLTDRHELDNPNFFFWIAEAYLAKCDYENSKSWNDRGLSFFSTNDYLLHQKQRIKLKQLV